MNHLTTVSRAALLVASLGTLAIGCHSGGAPKGSPPVPVRVATVSRINVPINIDASGVVEPMQTVNVEAQISGTILDVTFKQGDWVTRGQVLFRLDPRPQQAVLMQARANLARDEAQAVAAKHDDERYAALAAEGYVTASQAEQMHATAVAAAASATADRAMVQAAEVTLGYATIRAPIDGRTGSLLVRRGNLVSPGGTPLVVINQLRPIEARFPVLSSDFTLMRNALAQHPLPVVATSSDSGGITEQGQVTFLDNAIDSLTGTVTGRAVFANTGARLWPGQLVFLTVQAGVQRGVLTVPSSAVLVGQNGSYVYVIDRAKMTAQMRNVAVGRAAGDTTIIASGLTQGEMVVTDGQSRLNPGARVAIASPRSGAGAAAGAGGITGGVADNGAEAAMQSGANGGANGSAGGSGGSARGGTNPTGTSAAIGAVRGQVMSSASAPAASAPRTAPTTTAAPLVTSPPATGLSTSPPPSPTAGTRATSPTATPSSATPTTSGTAARPATTTPAVPR